MLKWTTDARWLIAIVLVCTLAAQARVQKQRGLSIIKSHLKDASGTANYDQSSELQIMPNAQLVRYEWDETTPAVSSLVVTPTNEFLIKKISLSTSAKPAEQPFLMPNTSMILENNFFVHLEVLLWG